MASTIELNSGWLRLEFFLPANNNAEVRAVRWIATKLYELYGGATHSTAQPPVFRGWYTNDDGDLIPDSVCLLIVLLKGDLERGDVVVSCEKVLRMVDEKYKKVRSPQQEIWMLANSGNIFALKNA